MPTLHTRYQLLLFDKSPLIDDPALPWTSPAFRALLEGVPDQQYPSDGLLDPTSPPPGLSKQEHSQILSFAEFLRNRSESHITHLTYISKTKADTWNPARKAYLQWFSKLWRQSRANVKIDTFMAENEVMPWQRAPLEGKDLAKVSVSDGLLVTLLISVYRLNTWDMITPGQ